MNCGFSRVQRLCCSVCLRATPLSTRRLVWTTYRFLETSNGPQGPRPDHKVAKAQPQRPIDPIPYDRDAYVVRICRNLRLQKPTKYAFLAGLYGGRVQEDGRLVDLLPSSKSQLKLSTGNTGEP